MNIFIKSHHSIQGLLKKYYRKLDVVLFTDPGYDVPKYIETHANELLHLSLHDVNKDASKDSKIISPKKEDVEKILNWAKGRKNIACCCHAGISRSSAAAYLIVCQEVGVPEALKRIKLHKHRPNKLIVHYGSQILNNNEVWTAFEKWIAKY